MQWTLMIFASIFLGLFLVTHALFNPLKHANTKLYRFQTTKMSLTNSFNLARIQDAFGIIPVCKEISKSTVVNDPTAGMTPEEQISYLSNVGGGMCGYPDWVRTTIGLGLNISLVTFAIFTLGYVVLGGYKFALEKQVDDLIDDAEKKAKKSGRIPLSNQVIDSITDDAGEAGPGTQQLLPKGGQNRSDRRLKNRLDKN